MTDRSEDLFAQAVGWLLVAVPAGAFLAFLAWITSYKIGVFGGLFYAVALAVWLGLLLWRWKRH